jgi:hypothetical protein
MDYTVYVDSNNRNQLLFPNSNSYTLFLTSPITNITKVEVLSAMLPNVFSSQYITLDIAELRTPRNLIADALTTADTYATNTGNTSAIHNLSVPTANAFYGSFAVIPIKSSGGSGAIYSNTTTDTNTAVTVNLEMYNSNYRLIQEYPSRIDKLDRLTITWRQPNNGNVFIDTNFSPAIDLGRNMFILRFVTVHVPDEPERPMSLPPPVAWNSGGDDKNKQLMIVAGVALIGLLIIISVKVKP